MRRLAHETAIVVLVALALILAAPVSSPAAPRIKDIAMVEGVRTNQLIGYGLVVGLNGTGDKTGTRFTVQSVLNMLERLGVYITAGAVQLKNVAAVVVTADLPPFAKVGGKLDALVSSIGDATSLTGGTLLMTPLIGIDKRIYALAQGPLLVGGFQVAGAGGTAAGKNHPTVGRIPQGATVEREVPYPINDRADVRITLDRSDFITANRMAQTINRHLGGDLARTLDASTVDVGVPAQFRGNIVPLVAMIEQLPVEVDDSARVIVDERTGTVVMGASVKIDKVAVAHGNISVQIQETQEVSQPLPFSRGQTVVVPETTIQVTEEKRKLVVLDTGVTIGELVRGINSIGATPRDLIAILQALKAAGALHAKLEII